MRPAFISQLSAEHLTNFDSLPGSALVDMAVVLRVVGISRPTCYRWMERGLLPAPARSAERGKGKNLWRVADLRNFLAGGAA